MTKETMIQLAKREQGYSVTHGTPEQEQKLAVKLINSNVLKIVEKYPFEGGCKLKAIM